MHQRRVRSHLFLITGVFLLGACAPIITEEPVQVSLAPMEQPKGSQVGDVSYILHNGTSELRSEVVARDSETISFAESDGCSTTLLTMGFAPALKYDNCGGSSGTQNVKLETDSPWPLTLGKTWRYSFSGESAQGETWKGERECEVEAETRITAPIGTHDAYKVVCTDPWRVRTYYVAPEIGKVVIYLRHHPRLNRTNRYELVRIENATS